MPVHFLKINPEDSNARLDVFLAQHLPDMASRSFVQKLNEAGFVRVNENLAKSNCRLVVGDDVHVDIPNNFLTPSYVAAENIPLDIFYEDDYLLIVNKPSGMLVHPAQGFFTGTLVNALLHHCARLSDCNSSMPSSSMRAGIVHRLDKETSGLILVAKDNITHAKLAKQFQRHVVKKKYLALVEGEVPFDEGVINAPIGRNPVHREKKMVDFSDSARESKTFYKVIKRFQGNSLVALFPQTGRTHQLRVHMKYLHHPILGDDKYGERVTFPRLALHAQAIGFMHPKNNCFVEFSLRPPQEFLSKVAL